MSFLSFLHGLRLHSGLLGPAGASYLILLCCGFFYFSDERALWWEKGYVSHVHYAEFDVGYMDG